MGFIRCSCGTDGALNRIHRQVHVGKWVLGQCPAKKRQHGWGRDLPVRNGPSHGGKYYLGETDNSLVLNYYSDTYLGVSAPTEQ